MKQFRFIHPSSLVGVEKVQREIAVGELVSTRPWVPTPDPAAQCTYIVREIQCHLSFCRNEYENMIEWFSHVAK